MRRAAVRDRSGTRTNNLRKAIPPLRSNAGYGRREVAPLTDKPFSKKEERKLLDALGRVLSKDFPNPERVGCPSRDLLKGLASRKLSLAEAEPWMDHFGKCSPCFRDYTELRRLIERRRKLSYLGIAAVMSLRLASCCGYGALVSKLSFPHTITSSPT